VAAHLTNCPDCKVEPGVQHLVGCDVERCRQCGGQAISCGCDPGVEPSVWTGEWPGHAECRDYNLYARLVPGRGWVTCSQEHPLARPDLNRLTSTGEWYPDLNRWVVHECLDMGILEVMDFRAKDPEAAPHVVCAIAFGRPSDPTPAFRMAPPAGESFEVLWRRTTEEEYPAGTPGPAWPGFKFYGVGRWDGYPGESHPLLGKRIDRYPGRIPSFCDIALSPETAADVMNALARFGWELTACPDGWDGFGPQAIKNAADPELIGDTTPVSGAELRRGCKLPPALPDELEEIPAGEPNSG